MGFVFGLVAAISFSSASIMFKKGQAGRPDDDGHVVSVLVNLVILGAAAAVVTWEPWSTSGFVGLVIGGIVGTVGGRYSLLRGVRLIGPSRGNAFMTTTPIAAAVVGWIVLGERVAPLEAVGAALSIYGLLRIIRARSSGTGAEPTPLGHYLIAAAAPTFFGIAFVARKWGLLRMPGSVTGAFIGTAAAVGVLIVIEAFRGRLGFLVRTSRARFPWWYVGAGAGTSAALLSQFQALARLEAWIVGILQGTQGIWTLILSAMFLRNEEMIDRRLVLNIGIVFAGVVLIAAV